MLGRYRGSVLGVGWSVLTPMAMLAVYTLVFRHIFKAKWPGVEDGNMSFALNLFAGLLVFNWAAEFLSRAPRLMTDQPNLVTKVVFPLQVLPWSVLLSSFFHVLVSCAVWLAGCLVVWTRCADLLAGIAFGVFGHWRQPCWAWAGPCRPWAFTFRDLGEIVGLFMGMMLFLTPVFFPLSVLPEFLQVWVQLQPAWPHPLRPCVNIGLMGHVAQFCGATAVIV